MSGGTIPDEFDRPLTELEQALLGVRRAACWATAAGADIERILAEARFGANVEVQLSSKARAKIKRNPRGLVESPDRFAD